MSSDKLSSMETNSNEVSPTEIFPEVSVIFPCLNEQGSIADCVADAKKFLSEMKLEHEVIVVDNNSIDNSATLAEAAGAKVVLEENRGYGNAYLAGLKQARGKFIIMADPDRTYDFADIPLFLEKLLGGSSFVIGNRFSKCSENIPLLRRAGNVSLNAVFDSLFDAGIIDPHCGFRGIKREALNKLELSEQGFPFALEFLLECIDKNISISQIEINYSERIGSSKLHALFDGFRHLRFMVLRKAGQAGKAIKLG